MKIVKKGLILLSVGSVVFFGIPFGMMALNSGEYSGSPKDCAVIFGAAVWRDDIPTQALNDRIQAGVELYNNGKVDCLVVSGGPSTLGSHEAEVMAKEALLGGVLSSDIIKDYEGLSTFETIKNLDSNKSYIFVSNDFHLGRIKFFAWKSDLIDYGTHAAKELDGSYEKKNYYRWREVFGFWYYAFKSF